MSLLGPRIVVYERSDPLITIRLRKKLPSPPGGITPYLLTGSPTVDFYAKANPNDVDASALFHYATNTGQIIITLDGTSGQYSEVTIQFANADLPTPKNVFYYMSVTKSGKKEIVANNILEIRNI